MTFFEYIAVAMSIVLSLSAAQLLSGVRLLFDPVRRDWIHGVWVLHLLILHVVIWWSFWAFRDASWNLGTFSLALLAPAALFVAGNALVASDSSISLREHFLANRTQFFTARALLVGSAWVGSYVHLGVPIFAPQRLVGLALIAICAIGIASADRRVQGVIAILALLIEVLVVGYLRFDAGSWGGGSQ